MIIYGMRLDCVSYLQILEHFLVFSECRVMAWYVHVQRVQLLLFLLLQPTFKALLMLVDQQRK
jgi:hypothetical protein